MPNSGAVGIEPTFGVPKTPALPLRYAPMCVLHNSSIFLVPIASTIRTPALLFPFQTEPFEESEIHTTSTRSHTDFCKAFQFLAFRLVHTIMPHLFDKDSLPLAIPRMTDMDVLATLADIDFSIIVNPIEMTNPTA